MRKPMLAFSIFVVLFFMTGCGGQSTPVVQNPVQPVQTAPVGLTVTDTPPAGVTVLFFQLSITGAMLTPSSGSPVSLLSSTHPIPVNVSQLLTDTAFVGSQNVDAGTYTGLSLTFANPQLTIFNASDSALSSTCAVGNVCQVTPTTTPGSSLTLNFSSSPFPVTLSANSPLAFQLDIHLDNIIQSDLSMDLTATNGVTLSQVTPPQPGGPIPALGKLTGTVQGTGTNQFTLQTLEGRTFTINVNGSTTFSNFPSSTNCSTSAETFGCLATGQVVQVTVTLQPDGTLLATAVNYIQLPTQQTVEGNIIGLSTSGNNTMMDLIIQQQPLAANADVLPVGKHASVIVPSTGVDFGVDWGSFTLPSGVTFSFSTPADLQVGQDVLVVVEGTVTQPANSQAGNSNSSGTNSSNGSGTSGGNGSGTSGWNGWNGPSPFGRPNVSFTASSITLEPSQITGTVASLPTSGSLSFTLAIMPVFFVPPAATWGTPPSWAPVTITVQTASDTTFTNFTTNSLAGLAVNDVVSVHGWVFSTPTGATKVTLAADAIVDRQGPTPFF